MHVEFESLLDHVLWVSLMMFVVMLLTVVLHIVITSSEWLWHSGVEGWVVENWKTFLEVNIDYNTFILVSEHLEDILFFDSNIFEGVLVSIKFEIEI